MQTIASPEWDAINKMLWFVFKADISCFSNGKSWFFVPVIYLAAAVAIICEHDVGIEFFSTKMKSLVITFTAFILLWHNKRYKIQ